MTPPTTSVVEPATASTVPDVASVTGSTIPEVASGDAFDRVGRRVHDLVHGVGQRVGEGFGSTGNGIRGLVDDPLDRVHQIGRAGRGLCDGSQQRIDG